AVRSSSPFEEGSMLLYRVRILLWPLSILAWAVAPSVVLGLTFTDDPLVPDATMIKAEHFRQIRSDIDTLRVALGLGPYPWTNPSPTPGKTVIQALDLIDIR